MSSRAYSIEDFGPNAGYVAELLKLYESGSPLVDSSWQKFFGGDTNGNASGLSKESLLAQLQVFQLIASYRKLGHLIADSNPLKFATPKPPTPEELKFENYKFESSQLDQNFFSLGLSSASDSKPASILEQLKKCYCGSVGFEFEHINDKKIRDWMTNIAEKEFPKRNWFNKEAKLRYLHRLIEAESIDNFLHTRFIGAKRFSILGGETFTVVLQRLLESSAEHGVEDIVLTMAHRGRLNGVVTFAGKPVLELMAEFEDKSTASKVGGGDVKYHLGGTHVHKLAAGSVRFTIPPNPSHLEVVNSVGCGMVRAKQDNQYSNKREAALSVQVHGDSAFIGQGISAEILNFSKLKGYETGGTIHIAINNQVGFTTGYVDARSTPYCSDVVKGFDVPVLHVNSDDIEASAWVADVALRFRQEFKQDIFIDLICSRKYGHNEGDDPSFTQPLLYKELANRKFSSITYSAQLVKENVATQAEVDSLREKTESLLKSIVEKPSEPAEVKYDFKVNENNKTGVEISRLKAVAQSLLPNNPKFEVHPKLKTIITKRIQSLELEKGIDWGFAEAMAFGTLLQDGISIRISGQDSGRGTFSHRHLELHDYASAERFYPLQDFANASGLKTKFEVFNSPLSEVAVMGFDFGYSVESPKTLVMWEAQFGDFANGAQVIIDQFLASSEQKWNQRAGLVLLLPHGFEGLGPEHSSARVERFLQLCSHNNMTVINPTTPAQCFHMLRRQALSESQRPLIVMSPKSLLRLAEAGSSAKELISGKFEKVLVSGEAKKKTQPVVFCSGKVYYPVAKELGDKVKVVRIEQLYPWPEKEVKAALGDSKKAFWVQEDPENMGAARYVRPLLEELGAEYHYFGRDSAAGVATGSPSWHAKEEKAYLSKLKKALDL